jgi:hypothetical protein
MPTDIVSVVLVKLRWKKHTLVGMYARRNHMSVTYVQLQALVHTDMFVHVVKSAFAVYSVVVAMMKK